MRLAPGFVSNSTWTTDPRRAVRPPSALFGALVALVCLAGLVVVWLIIVAVGLQLVEVLDVLL